MLIDYYFILIPITLLGIILFFVSLFNIKLNIYLIALTLYFGTFLAIPLNFTLKAVQIFVVLGAIALFLITLVNNRDIFKIPAPYYLPFFLFIFTILLSFLNSEDITQSIRLFINYLWLQLMTFVLAVSIDTEKTLDNLIKFSILSCTITLLIGYFEQIGYYTGLYDPFLYFDSNSMFIANYGPILRMSPGTFPNEYGKILQTNAIVLSTLLILGKNYLSKLEKYSYFILLFFILIGLILNLSRACWVVYSIVLILILILNRLKLKTWIILILSTIGIIGVIYTVINRFINDNVWVVVIQRLMELQELSEHSAGSRLEFWKMAYDNFLNSIFIGNGFGLWVETHSVPLQLLVETGILGFIAFYSIIAFLFFKSIYLIRNTHNRLKVNVIAISLSILGCLLYDLINHGIHHFVLWFYIGLLLGGQSLIENGRLND